MARYDFLKTKAKSVFLASLSDLENFESDLSKEDWNRLIEIKEEVNQSIEASRSQGDIKGSLDASISLCLDSADFKLVKRFASEIHFFFIFSECVISEGNSLKISVTKSEADKCVRCLHRNKSVGASKDHPELCHRCVINIDGPGEDREFA